MRKNKQEPLEIKIKEFGRPLFKSKGQKAKVIDETKEFMEMKW